MQRNRDVGLYLLGTTESGKGMFGNFIVGEPVFPSAFRAQQPASDDRMFHILQQNRTVTVAEGPDIGTVHQRENNSRTFVRSVERFMRAMDGYFNRLYFFILILRYRERFMAQDGTIQFLKAVLGPDIVRDHIFIVMTGGEMFERHHGPGRQVFMTWCRSQERGDLRDLMEENQWRVHLFGGMGRFETDLENQLEELMDSIDHHRQAPEFRQYSMNNNYEIAAHTRITAVVTSRKGLVKMETDEKVKQILERLDNIRQQQDLHPSRQVFLLESLNTDTEQLVRDIHSEDCNTGIMGESLRQAQLANRSVKDAIVTCREGDTNLSQQVSVNLYKLLIFLIGVMVCQLVLWFYGRLGQETTGCWKSLLWAWLLCSAVCWFTNAPLRIFIFSLFTLMMGCLICSTFDS